MTSPTVAPDGAGTGDTPPKEHRHVGANFDTVANHYYMAQRGTPGDPERAKNLADFEAVLTEWQSREGNITSQYWCANVMAVAVVTDKDRFFCAGDPFLGEADLALATQMRYAERLARIAEEFLIGPARRTSIELIYAIETFALGCMDRLAADPAPQAGEAEELRAVTLAKVQEELALAREYTDGAWQRQAQIVYLQGMVLGVGVMAIAVATMAWLIALVPAPIAGMEFVPAVLFLGALGAVLSVMQRLTQGKLRIRLDSDAFAIRILGGFRPVVGGVVGVGILVLVLGGLLPLQVPDEPGSRAFFLAGLAFLAGFSERFAQDMIGAGKRSATSSPVDSPGPEGELTRG